MCFPERRSRTERDCTNLTRVGVRGALRKQRLASTCALASGQLSPDLMSILESLLHADAIGVDDALQQAGLESLHLLGTAFDSFRIRAIEIVRRFLLSPALHPSDDPTTVTLVLSAATRCYVALLGEKETGGASQATAVQAILNQLLSLERDSTTGAGQTEVGDGASYRNSDLAGDTAGNLVHAVSLLARESKSTAVSPTVFLTPISADPHPLVLFRCGDKLAVPCNRVLFQRISRSLASHCTS